MSSVIDLCGTMFRWAKFRPTKGSVKLHLLLDHDGYLLFSLVSSPRASSIRCAWQREMRFVTGENFSV